jgi:tetratricopeptide (TPR) repeat protein
LVNPLKGLGAAQLENERPDQAFKTFNRAAHITHVNEGPHNLDQVEILESLAETQLRMGETRDARLMLDRIHGLNVRHFEKNPMGLLPSLMNRATWQHRAGYYEEERISYRRAIRIVEAGAGRNHPMLIEPLVRLGESFYYVDTTIAVSQPYGTIAGVETYFKRAARIADQAEDLDWQTITKAKLAMADYYMYVEEHGRAGRQYREVWEFLSTDDERLAARHELMEQPIALRPNELPPYAGGIPAKNLEPGELIVGKIVVDYTITIRGRVRELRTEAIPPDFTDMQRMVHREVRRRLFRPKFVEAEAVQVEGIVFEHNFSYLQIDLDTMRAKKTQASGGR